MKFVPFFQTEGDEALSEYALRRVDHPGSVSGRCDLIEHIGKTLREGSDLVALIGNEVDLLRSRSDRVCASPQHVAANLDPRERHSPVGVGRVDDLQLESIGW